jgi:hypothetical protein
MTTTLGLLPCCVIGNIVAIPKPTYTAEGKSLSAALRHVVPELQSVGLNILPDCLDAAGVILCGHIWRNTY